METIIHQSLANIFLSNTSCGFNLSYIKKKLVSTETFFICEEDLVMLFQTFSEVVSVQIGLLTTFLHYFITTGFDV